MGFKLSPRNHQNEAPNIPDGENNVIGRYDYPHRNIGQKCWHASAAHIAIRSPGFQQRTSLYLILRVSFQRADGAAIVNSARVPAIPKPLAKLCAQSVACVGMRKRQAGAIGHVDSRSLLENVPSARLSLG